MRLKSVAITFVSMVTTFYSIAAETLAPINPDNLDPDSAHVCQEIEREPYTMRVSFNQYYRQKTTTWCFSVPPRCTQYSLASKTAYRQETRYRDRTSYFCCSGYKAIPGHSYCVPKCEHDCYEEQEQGYCIMPDQCRCHPGFKGTYCESGCDADHWGPNCTRPCYCGTHGSCDPANGNCICSIGYTGQNCSQQCVDSFGLHCVHPCICENDAECDNVNGRCICQQGYYGVYCQKECAPSAIGEQGCEQVCPCQNGGVCDEITNECICPAGVKGRYCTQFCDEFHWGVNCMNRCECNFGTCNRAYGYCRCDLGYDGDTCQIACPDGYYGAGCLTPCGCWNGGRCYRNEDTQFIECNCANTGFHGDVCSVRDCPSGEYLLSGSTDICQNCTCEWINTQSCHPLTGTCACQPGYKGDECEEICTMPFYGQECSQVCQCANGDCDHVTGECIECHPGYIGSNCDTPCPQGTWGMDCVNDCTCQNSAKCHVRSGYCECQPGYAGQNCTTYCEEGKYGSDCTEDCTCNEDRSTCSPINGQCLCHPGFIGENCEDTCDPWTHGYFCLSDCDCTTQGTESCEPTTGSCNCKGGWSGQKCDTICGNNNWGPHCVNTCNCNGNGYCHGVTGSCVCFEGYQGDQCEQDNNGIVVVAQQTGGDTTKTSTTPLIIAIVIPCVVLLVILALVVAYYMRKIRFLKEENLRVRYEASGTLPGQTHIPNGNVAIGVENPTYVDDNDRNERRYPHLSQRASVAPPPLPHRQQSCDTCDDIDVEKLRVQMDAEGGRPVSSHYADIDDQEDRYTTLKSIAGASTAATTGSESGGFLFTSGEDQADAGHRTGSSSMRSDANGGFTNKTYVDMSGSTQTNSAAQPNDAFTSPSTNVYIPDQPNVLSSTASADIDHHPVGHLTHQTSKEYDFPKSTRLSSVSSPDPELSQPEGYVNSNLRSPFENNDTNTRQENPYDTPNKSIPPDSDRKQNGSLTNNGYLTPDNDVNKINASM